MSTRKRILLDNKKDEYEFVDLDLPSGALWATRNIGAKNPEDAGLYFSWGNVDGHTLDDGYTFDQATYNTTPATGITGLSKKGNFAPDSGYDAARENLGGLWHMPTHAEAYELTNNCTKSVADGVLTFTRNGKTLVMPASDLWTSAFYQTNFAYTVRGRDGVTSNTEMYRAEQVRAVKNVYYPGKQGVFIYDVNDKFYTPDEWRYYLSNGSVTNEDDAVGVAIITGEGHDFVISNSHSSHIIYSDSTVDFSGLTANPKCGEDNTDALIASYGDSTDYAAGYVRNITFKNGKHAYIPSHWEMIRIYNNKDKINECRTLIGGVIMANTYHYTSRPGQKNGSDNRMYIMSTANAAQAQRIISASGPIIPTFSLD